MAQFQSKKEMIKAGIKSLPMRVGLAAGALTLASSSFAAGDDVDVTGVLTKLSSGLTAIGSVAVAALGLVVLVKTYKYIRTAM